MLIDATRPWPYPPVSLPRKEIMEDALGYKSVRVDHEEQNAPNR
jgi:hypothetical protein